jgi:hypothetical protein
MWIGTLAIVIALAAGTTAFWAAYEKRVPMMTLLGSALWAYAAWNADTIRHGTQTVVVEQTPTLPYIFYFFAAVNLLLLFFWLWSEPEDRQALLQQL